MAFNYQRQPKINYCRHKSANRNQTATETNLITFENKTYQSMIAITDEYMKQMLATTKSYTIMTLKPGPNINHPNLKQIIWEHGRRNFELRADGLLPVVCPVTDDADISGFGIFSTTAEETKKILDDDPAVVAGIFVYEVYPVKSFPGDKLP
jgi:hypothetical protein